jgi:alanine racemase
VTPHPVWAEIDLSAIAHNVSELRRVTSSDAQFMAVVKANGYGHGAEAVARTALDNGADRLALARLDEAVDLRDAGIDAPMLVFGYTPPERADELLKHDLTQTVFSLEAARDLSDAAGALGRPIRVHLKVDTGMGRVGLLAVDGEDALREAETILGLPGLTVEGIYTHFATADSANKKLARKQLARFMAFTGNLKKRDVAIPIRHAANSAGLIDMPESHLEMVRPGISLYGLYPSDEVKTHRVALKPAMTLKARIVQLKEVPEGYTISYGATYTAPGPTRIATIPVGYADGYDRLLSNQGSMLVRGLRAPIVGRVCMDSTMIDVTDVPGVQTGDEVAIFGGSAENVVTVDEVAAMLGTINYEVVSTVMARAPRVYMGGR